MFLLHSKQQQGRRKLKAGGGRARQAKAIGGVFDIPALCEDAKII
jgi:hypothetical protein